MCSGSLGVSISTGHSELLNSVVAPISNAATFFGYAEDDWRFNYVHNMVIQPDGKIVVVGHCPIDPDGDHYSDDQDLLVFRLNTGGGLDRGFSSGGVFTFDGG